MSKTPSLIRITALCAAAALLLWVLPLGVFIKPSQEKTACGGKRAFHMCSSMSVAAAPAATSDVLAYAQTASDLLKTSKAASGCSDEVLLEDAERRCHLPASVLAYERFVFLDTPVLLLQDPVPKF